MTHCPESGAQTPNPTTPLVEEGPYTIEAMTEMPGWVRSGCGDAAYYCEEKNATFGVDKDTKKVFVPDALPDISSHVNFTTDILNAQPDLYEKLKGRKTEMGVCLTDCIKTGIDNPGHPHIKTCGIVAGDEESYEVFKELFDPVISNRHNGYPADGIQPTNLDINKLSCTDIDPEGKYVLTSRVRTGRSIRGFKLPPCISFQDRRKIEHLVVQGLLSMTGHFEGDYFPLHGSRSYQLKPNGMSKDKEEELRNCGNMFQEPDSTLLLASGMGRHWPDARGIFHNKKADLFVWVGEEDHLRIISMQGERSGPTEEGKNFRDVITRFISACSEVENCLKNLGISFMHNDHHGFILTCPSNLGTGLRAGCMVKLPKLSARGDWKTLVGCMKLQARGTGGVDSSSTGGTWDISNSDRIGIGEIDLCNILIQGVAQLVKWESMIDAGKDPEKEIQEKINEAKDAFRFIRHNQ